MEEISLEDKYKMHMANMKVKLAIAEVEKYIAQQDLASLNYKFLVSQIYNKYNITENDQLTDLGTIIRKESENNENVEKNQ